MQRNIIEGFKLHPMIKHVFYIACIAICAMIYIYQHVVIIKLGYKIKKNEVFYEELLDEKMRLLSLLSQLESPKNIQILLADAKIDLKPSNKPNVIMVKI